ncbi:MAG TPA: class I SAM-dependent DNA methyltransferase [Candidatus Kapabacteria bacterium]|nr:class I SAM-dependent DNA methyltransferase [Candidatus Kapabacteria bacterium]
MSKEKSLEQTLWEASKKLRKNIDAAEYKHILLGLIFLKHISGACEAFYLKLKAGQGKYSGSNPEDIQRYHSENILFVPPQARWPFLMARAKDPQIGKVIDEAMDAIENLNPTLRGVLPGEYSRPNLDSLNLGQLIELIGAMPPGETQSENSDRLGRVYEYCLGEFALAEGKRGGQFYTPPCIVKLLVEMLEPYNGSVYDPCCGTGGMFIQSENFTLAHQGRPGYIPIYGQESNATTYRLCRMNLAIRGIDASNIKWNNEGSFLKDAHPHLKADYILANPPFNDSDWNGDLLQEDPRWEFGIPPARNANYAWLQHIVFHLSPGGTAGVVLANGSLSTPNTQEKNIRKNLVEKGIVDCIVSLPDRLFYNTSIPACLWLLTRNKKGRGSRENEILFIDARKRGEMINRRNRQLSNEDISTIAGLYHSWRSKETSYSDIAGLCKSAAIGDVTRHGYILNPGRYVDTPEESEPDIPFEQQFKQLIEDMDNQMKEGLRLYLIIKKNLDKITVT